MRRLEAAGIIAGYQAVLSLEKLSKPVTVFAEIIMDKQGRSDRLEKRLAGIEEIVECWEVSGNVDYVARFVCADLARYETLTTDLIDEAELGVARIVSHIALRPVRRFTGYPASVLTPPARAGSETESPQPFLLCAMQPHSRICRAAARIQPPPAREKPPSSRRRGASS